MVETIQYINRVKPCYSATVFFIAINAACQWLC